VNGHQQGWGAPPSRGWGAPARPVSQGHGYAAQAPHGSHPPVARPAAPRGTSRAPLWIGLGVLALFGSCGTCAAIGALLPEAERPAAAVDDGDESVRDAVDASNKGGPELRRDVPRAAATTIRQARAAIGAGDHRALEKQLAREFGSYQVEDELEATTARAAVEGWNENPAMLKRIDRALTERCDVDRYDDGHVLIMCGRERAGSTFVMVSNMVDDAEREDRFRITGVGTFE